MQSVGTAAASSTDRSILVIRQPEAILNFAPTEVQGRWRAFMQDLRRFKDELGFRSVPTLKAVDRHYRDGHAILESHPLIMVAHRFGAVPALLIGSLESQSVAFLPESFGLRDGSDRSRPEERAEVLRSHRRYLPELFNAYFEQIADYFDAILFGASAISATRFCSKIRAITGESIRTKLVDIEDRQPSDGEAYDIAQEIREMYAETLNEGRAVYQFANLLVNHVYRFFCLDVEGQIEKYRQRIASLPSDDDGFDSSNVAFIKRCVTNIEYPDDAFLDEVNQSRVTRPSWLSRMAIAAAFVAELNEYTKGERLDWPGVFVSHHFGVVDSDAFAERLSSITTEQRIPATIIRGRQIRRDIRWSLLSRIWLADHQALFLPREYRQADGALKPLSPDEDWVMFELIFGRLLEHPLTTIVRSPVSTDSISNFRAQVSAYTERRETDHVPAEGWAGFVAETKRQLHEELRSRRYLEFAPENSDEFVVGFREAVAQPAASRFVDLLFESWRWFFDASTWSVVQLLIRSNQGPGYTTNPVQALNSTTTIKGLAGFISRRSREDDSLEWAVAKDDASLRDRTRAHIDKLREFAFLLDGRPHRPVSVQTVEGKQKIFFRLGAVYELACRRLGLPVVNDRVLRLVDVLLQRRLD